MQAVWDKERQMLTLPEHGIPRPEWEHRRATMTDTKCIAAAQKLQALGYEWKGDEWRKPDPPTRYGCHCDLDPGDEPDGCVLDYGRPEDCRLAMALVAEGKRREDCREWRPVVFVSA